MPREPRERHLANGGGTGRHNGLGIQGVTTDAKSVLILLGFPAQSNFITLSPSLPPSRLAFRCRFLLLGKFSQHEHEARRRE